MESSNISIRQAPQKEIYLGYEIKHPELKLKVAIDALREQREQAQNYNPISFAAKTAVATFSILGKFFFG